MKKFIIPILLLVILVIGYVLYVLFSSNTSAFGDKATLYIPTGSSYEQVIQKLSEQHILKDLASFESMASRFGYTKQVKPGKYEIRQGMGNFTLVNMLKGGKQVPVKLVINKLRTKKDIIRKICSQLEADSNDVEALLRDSNFLAKYQIDSNQLQCMILPDTYQFFWNTDAKKALEKIGRNYLKFWTSERKAKASKQGMTQAEIITLASIVEEETNIQEDKLKIASTYMNRLRIGMPLQADPTLKFAVNDFTLRRLLTVHTQVNSPYNTYVNRGLPPGPICTPSMKTIDAVLDAPKTTYLYFCAREDFKGYSNFASTYEEHQQNAKRYQAALNARGIKK